MAARTAPAADLVDELVHQFSDPFAFYRELIQNGIDAGSRRIEVTLSFHPGRGSGTATAQVADWGEGMNRDLLENYLLTKFRSTKEGDLTKIGRFGIGFVSVFAPEPDLVVVETGRDGEAWRLLFQRDKTYELFRSPEPVEGTRVILHKQMKAPEYDAFRERSREAIQRWCRHSEAEVMFAAGDASGGAVPEPASVREPFTVDAPFAVEHVEEGTRVVAGPSRQEPPLCGMYNRGLTLLELREALFPGVTFKIASRYLEHTLTRDNVRRDEHFEKAMRLVRELVEGPLKERLAPELRACAERRAWADYRVLLRHAKGKLDGDALWFPLAQGGAADGKALRRAARKAGVLAMARGRDALVDRLAAAEIPVLLADAGGELVEIAKAALGISECKFADEAYCIAEPVEAPGGPELLRALRPMLEEAQLPSEKLLVATLRGAGASAIYSLVDRIGEPQVVRPLPPLHIPGNQTRILCLNRGHARVAQALELARSRSSLAAFLLYRLLAVGEVTRDAKRDWAIAEKALSR